MAYDSDERHLTRIMPLVSLRNYVAVAPRGTLIAAGGESQAGCFGWEQAEDEVNQAEQRIFDSIDQVTQKLNISAATDLPSRLRLRGHDGLSRGHEAS